MCKKKGRTGIMLIIIALLLGISVLPSAAAEGTSLTIGGVIVTVTDNGTDILVTYELEAGMDEWFVAHSCTNIGGTAGTHVAGSVPWTDSINMSSAGISKGQAVSVGFIVWLQKADETMTIVSDSQTLYKSGSDWLPAVAAWECDEWINAPEIAALRSSVSPSPDFIWSMEKLTWEEARSGQLVEFKRDFNLPGEARHVRLSITCDNGYQAAIGSFTGESETLSPGWMGDFTLVDSHGWETLEVYDELNSNIMADLNFVNGNNTLSIICVNQSTEAGDWDTNPGGLIYALEITYTPTNVPAGHLEYTVKGSDEPATPPSSTYTYTPPTVFYNLNIAVEGDGTVLPGAGTYSHGSGTRCMIQVTPGEGSVFEGWFGANGADVIDTGSMYAIDMTSDKSIIARFKSEAAEPVVETPVPEEEPEATEAFVDMSEEAVLLDEAVPISGTLPQTGGIPVTLFVLAGALMTALGTTIKRKPSK